MMHPWKRWEGQAVNQTFSLGTYLGGSNHSAVFLTEYGNSNKAVAKLIRVDLDQAATQMSRLESAARLSCPSLIRLYDWGLWRKDDEHLFYVVMEYADEDLSQVLPSRPLTVAETRDMLLSALDGLACLHREGLVHGRLRPSNILAVGDQVKISADLLDLAGDALERPNLYAPPEASRGEFLAAGDIWTLGLIIVEALTQHLPPRDGQVLAFAESLPEPFLDIARHCLEADPRRRWPAAWIKARLTDAAPSPQPAREDVRPVAGPELNRHLMWVAGAAVVLGGILIASNLPIPSGGHSSPTTPVRAAAVKPERKPNPQPTIVYERPSPFGAKQPRPGTSASTAVTEADRAAETAPLLDASISSQEGPIHKVLPDVPAKARETIQGKVAINILAQVDAAGNVVQLSLEPPRSSPYFADLALAAVRVWKFAAAGQPGAVLTPWLIQFEFRRTDTTVKVAPVRE
jgi:serine/threonine protein kinase